MLRNVKQFAERSPRYQRFADRVELGIGAFSFGLVGLLVLAGVVAAVVAVYRLFS